MEKKFREKSKNEKDKEGDFSEDIRDKGIRGITSADLIECSNCGRKYFRGERHKC